MEQAVARSARSFSAWFWLVLMLGMAILFAVGAVDRRDAGLAVSAVGAAVLAALSFLSPLPLTVDLRKAFRLPQPVQPDLAVLAGVGFALLLIGSAIRWLG